jgi:putative peptidoglycan lipid II flippase
MSQSWNTDTGPRPALGTTSARLVAVRLKSANKNIFRALLSLSSANLLIRLMGLINTVIVTARFGQGPAMDAYFVATTVPMLLAQLLGSSVEGSFVPVYASMRAKGGREKASRLFSTLLNLLIIISGLLTLGMIFFREPLLHISAPGTSPQVLAQTVALAPLVFPLLSVMILNSYMESLLNAEGKFGWPAYSGLLVPLITAAFVLLLGGNDGVLAIGLGTLVGQCVQSCFFIIRAQRAKLKYRFILDLGTPEMREITIRAWPSLLAGVIALASPLVDQIFASYQTSGTIAAINNALKITGVPIGVLFAATGRAILPYFATQIATNDMKAFKNTLRLYTWGIAIVTFCVSLFMIVFSRLIVSILFQRGAFSEADVNLVAITLSGFAIGLFPMAIGFVFGQAFTALGKTRFLMYITVMSVFLNASFDAFFGNLWHSFGIAFATSAYYFCSMSVQLFVLRRTLGKLDLLKPPSEVLKVAGQIGLGPLYTKWVAWQEEQSISLQEFYQQVLRWLFILLVFASGIVGTILNALMTLRLAFGSLVIFAFLRYQYILLLAWGTINVFIGSALPFFNGNNLLSGLTLPTTLLLFYFPIKVPVQRMLMGPLERWVLAYTAWDFLYKLDFPARFLWGQRAHYHGHQYPKAAAFLHRCTASSGYFYPHLRPVGIRYTQY